MVININADNLELDESGANTRVVNVNAGDGADVTEEEVFIPDYDEDYDEEEDLEDDDNIGVVSLRYVDANDDDADSGAGTVATDVGVDGDA